MNRTFLILLMIGTALMVAVIGSRETHDTIDTMPWHIQVVDNGYTRIFGITLGKTNIQDAHQILAHFSETRLYTVNNKIELQAHFDEFSLGGLLAEIDLIYDIPETLLIELQQHAMDSEQGEYQILNDDLLMNLLTTPIKQLIYNPSIDYDSDIITQRFGLPESSETVNDTVEKLNYPDIGLVIYLNTKGPEKFIYSQLATAFPSKN
ncbi:MAG: hypothetical protein OEY87_08950 [Gammaproteobacteria bacterium]|nr:hypothetical protein [Gammaproteobacteria bacterium]MDH5736234.1 hypothetical protein [Gammaproteobacteria bacterium]